MGHWFSIKHKHVYWLLSFILFFSLVYNIFYFLTTYFQKNRYSKAHFSPKVGAKNNRVLIPEVVSLRCKRLGGI